MKKREENSVHGEETLRDNLYQEFGPKFHQRSHIFSRELLISDPDQKNIQRREETVPIAWEEGSSPCPTVEEMSHRGGALGGSSSEASSSLLTPSPLHNCTVPDRIPTTPSVTPGGLNGESSQETTASSRVDATPATPPPAIRSRDVTRQRARSARWSPLGACCW